MAVKRERLGILLAFLAYASWGLLSPVGKRFLDAGEYEPLGLNFVRFSLATVALLFVLGPRAALEGVRLLGNRWILGANLLANISLTLFLYALAILPEATPATLGFYTAPLFTALLAWWLLGEHVGAWFGPAAVGLLAGGYLALFGFDAPPSGFALGMALAVASAVIWALYSVALRKAAPDVPLKPLLATSFIAGTIWYGVLAIAIEGVPDLTHDATSWAWMALYVAVPTLASFILFNASLQLAPAGAVNLLVGAELAFTALFAALLFGDSFSVPQLVGLALVLASVTGYLWVREQRANRRYGPV